jgi:hypothetical protein
MLNWIVSCRSHISKLFPEYDPKFGCSRGKIEEVESMTVRDLWAADLTERLLLAPYVTLALAAKDRSSFFWYKSLEKSQFIELVFSNHLQILLFF